MIYTNTLNEWKFQQSNTKLKSQNKVQKSKVKENELNTFIIRMYTDSLDFYHTSKKVEEFFCPTKVLLMSGNKKFLSSLNKLLIRTYF